MRSPTRRLAILACLVLVPLVLSATGASAATVRWNETAKNGGAPVMGFRVQSFAFTATGWSATVSLKNLSKSTIVIGDNFGAAIFADHSTTDLSKVVGFAVAQSFSPARPKKLAPGASWSGTIGGTGHLNASTATRYARVVFGPLTDFPGQAGPVFWVTDHWLPIVPPPNPLSA